MFKLPTMYLMIWIFCCLTQTFKGLLERCHNISVFLVFVHFFVPRCILKEFICSLSTERWEMNSKKRRIYEGLFAFGKDKPKWKAWEILSQGYLVFSCTYFHFYTNEMHVRSSRRLMFTWVLVLFCQAVRIYIYIWCVNTKVYICCTKKTFLRYTFVKSATRADGKSNVSFAIYEQMYFISFLWTL